MHKRTFSFDEKEEMEARKARICEQQNGKCFFCLVDFNKDNVYPNMAHRIIDSNTNVVLYGYEILDNDLNFRATCPDCNSKAIVNPEGFEGRELIVEIMESL